MDELASHPHVRLVRTARLHLEAEPLVAGLRAAGVDPEVLVFLSKHKAASGRPSLTVHPVGNFAEAKFGGRPGRVSPAPAALQTELLRALARHRDAAGYAAEVTFEVTHHGPLVDVPACFLELGSAEPQWTDRDGASVVAHACLEAATRQPPPHPIVIGLGGGHYAPRFTEVALTRQVHFAHLVPSHAADAVSDAQAMLAELTLKSPGARGVYLHKGTLASGPVARWRDAAQALGLPFEESSSWAPHPRAAASAPQ